MTVFYLMGVLLLTGGDTMPISHEFPTVEACSNAMSDFIDYAKKSPGIEDIRVTCVEAKPFNKYQNP